MQKINGPFRLIHMDGRVYDCATIEDVFDYLSGHSRWPRYDDLIEHAGVGGRPFYRYSARDANNSAVIEFRKAYEQALNNHRWIVRDELGLIVPLSWLRKTFRICVAAARKRWNYSHRRVPRDELSTDWSVFRGLNIGYMGSKPRGGSLWRAVRTTQEIREQARVCDELAEYGIRVRPRRVDLPTLFDDQSRSNWKSKSWKNRRRTQYRDRG